MKKTVKKVNTVCSMMILICLLTGCAYSNFSVMNMESKDEGSIGRSSSYWSGIQIGEIISLKEGEEIHFYIEMEKGSVNFILKDSEGNEIYSVEKEGEYKGTETYTAKKSEKLWLTEKGSGFKGSYEITWGEAGNLSDDTETENDDI